MSQFWYIYSFQNHILNYANNIKFSKLKQNASQTQLITCLKIMIKVQSNSNVSATHVRICTYIFHSIKIKFFDVIEKNRYHSNQVNL